MARDVQPTLDLEFSPAQAPTPHIDGLQLHPDAVDARTERELLDEIDHRQWDAQMSRRVQHYGWRYDYKSRSVTRDCYLGPLPPFLGKLADGLFESTGFTPDQVIINEYEPGQGIAPHIDCVPCFGPVIATLSLGSTVEMDFINDDEGRSVTVVLPRRSLLVVERSARFEWRHGIAKRRSDPSSPVQRSRRVSVTMRTVTPST